MNINTNYNYPNNNHTNFKAIKVLLITFYYFFFICILNRQT